MLCRVSLHAGLDLVDKAFRYILRLMVSPALHLPSVPLAPLEGQECVTAGSGQVAASIRGPW